MQIESIDASGFLLWANGIRVFILPNAPFGPPLSGWRRCCGFWRNSDVQTRIKLARRLCKIEHFCQICPCRQRRPFISFFAPIGNFASPLICSAGGAWFWMIGCSRIRSTGKKRARSSFFSGSKGAISYFDFIGPFSPVCSQSRYGTFVPRPFRNVLVSAPKCTMIPGFCCPAGSRSAPYGFPSTIWRALWTRIRNGNHLLELTRTPSNIAHIYVFRSL